MGNANGQCQHTPLDQFDNPCPECPEWPADKPFVFGGAGLMNLCNLTADIKKREKKRRQKQKREQLRNKIKCDDCSNAVFSTEPEYLEHCSVNYHGKFRVANN